MEYRNPVFNAHGTIDCEINHPTYGWIPFTASPDDTSEDGRAIFAEASPNAGPYVPNINQQITAAPEDLFGGPTLGEIFNGH